MAPGLESYSQADWVDAMTRVTKFARGLRVVLPRHLTIEDLVQTALQQVINGTRKFDPAKSSLAGVLCNTIRSIVSPKGLAEYHNRMPLATELEQAAAVAVEPDEECLFPAADREMIFERAKREAGSNRLLADYVDAYRANFSSQESAELLGTTVDRVYELRRELKDLLVQVVEALKPSDRLI